MGLESCSNDCLVVRAPGASTAGKTFSAEVSGMVPASKAIRYGESGAAVTSLIGVCSRAASSWASLGPSPMASTSVVELLNRFNGPPRLAWTKPSWV